MPDEMFDLRLPDGVQTRLEWLLDKQDRGQCLTVEERAEAEGLVKLAELLEILRIRAERVADDQSCPTETRVRADDFLRDSKAFVTSLERTDGFDERAIEHPTWREVIEAISDIGKPECESVVSTRTRAVDPHDLRKSW